MLGLTIKALNFVLLIKVCKLRALIYLNFIIN